MILYNIIRFFVVVSSGLLFECLVCLVVILGFLGLAFGFVGCYLGFVGYYLWFWVLFGISWAYIWALDVCFCFVVFCIYICCFLGVCVCDVGVGIVLALCFMGIKGLGVWGGLGGLGRSGKGCTGFRIRIRVFFHFFG